MLVYPTSMLSYLNIFLEAPQADRPTVGLSRAGAWEYEETGIPAVGARGLTLSEKLAPLMIGRPGEEPVAVLLPLYEVDRDPRLQWARQAGVELEGEDGPLLQVPFSLWQEHAEEIVGAWVPERDAEGIERSLAIAEREFRFSQQALEATRLIRNCIVVLASHLGRSRREVGESLGLSLGRVQQLSEDPPPEVVKVVEEVLEAATLVAKNIGDRPCPREDVPKPRALSSEDLDRVLDSMLLLGLLEEDADGLRLTADGLALDAPRPAGRKQRKGAIDRERTSDATG